MDSERPRNATPKKPPARIYTWGSDVALTPFGEGCHSWNTAPQLEQDSELSVADVEQFPHRYLDGANNWLEMWA